jgi:hypothetical protein
MSLNVDAAQAIVVARLPIHRRWLIEETPLDFDFSIARGGLHSLPNDAFMCCEQSWPDLLMFGRYDFAEGGGASPRPGIKKSSGFVYGLDVERADALFLMNSSIERFVQTFVYLDSYLHHGSPLPPDVVDRVRHKDPVAYSDSDWRILIEQLMSA